MQVSRMLINIDVVCDYIPFVSTITNLVDLFQKTLTLPEPNRSQENPYYTYLREKDDFRCKVLLVPIFGNIFIMLYDLMNKCKQPDLASRLDQIDLLDNGIMFAECVGFGRVLENINKADAHIEELLKECNDQIKDDKMIILKPICLDTETRTQNAQTHIQDLNTKQIALQNLKDSQEKKEYILSMYLNQIRTVINQPEYNDIREDLNAYITRMETIGKLACQDLIPETAEVLQNSLENVSGWQDFLAIVARHSSN